MREDLSEYNSLNKKKYNIYDLSNGYGIWYTSSGLEFLFDLEDFDLIKDICWNINSEGYVRGWVNKDIGRVSMHNLICNKKMIDHANRLKYDNRKNNLRDCTNFENSINKNVYNNNSSGFIGVHYSTNKQRWVARISYNKKRKEKHFLNIQDALIARLQMELDYYGEDFSPQRHLFEKYSIKRKEK